MKLICTLLFALAIQNVLFAPVNAHATPLAASPKFAVLVGITDYPQKNVTKLDGCLNDVRDIRQRLISDFGFAPQHILKLTNEGAKRDDIVRAFRTQLRDKARQYPAGTFVFYFSGHGSQTPDLNGDEKVNDPRDAKDETLVTYDHDLVDDDLDVLCQEVRGVASFTGSLTVIIDACHSGTATRGSSQPNEPHVRSAVPDLQRIVPPLTSSSKVEVDDNAGSFAALSGCLADQTSIEKEFSIKNTGKSQTERREYHGVMTYYLLGAMDAATQTTTNGQIWTQVAGVLSGQYDQLPQLEGASTKQPFLGGSLKKSAPPIVYSSAGRTLTFDRGVEAGAIKGGFVSVFNRGKLKGQLPISSAQFGEATAKMPAGLRLAPTGTVELLTPYFGSEPLKVGLGAGIGSDNPVVKRLRERYDSDNKSFVRLARKGETPDVYLMRSGDYSAWNEIPLNGNAPNGEQEQQGYFVARAPGDRPIFQTFLRANNQNDISPTDEMLLFQTLEDYAAQSNVKTLSNQTKRGVAASQAVRVTARRVNGSADADGHWHANKDNPGLEIINLHRDKLLVDQGIRFDLANQTYTPLYVSVLWLSQDGSITALEDTQKRKQIVLSSRGQTGGKASTINYGIPGPTGNETIKVFVSRKPINVWYLERAPVGSGTSSRDASPFDVLAGQSLLNVVGGHTGGTRAAQSGPDAPDFESWDAESMTLTISR